LTSAEQAFVAGYLCHLAADEDWKRVDWNMIHTHGLLIWTDLPVPGSVIVSAFDILSSGIYRDFPSVASALGDASIPHILRYVPWEAFQTMWDVAQVQVLMNEPRPHL